MIEEQQKVASIVAGSKMHEEKLNAIFAAIKAWDGREEDAYDPKVNESLKAVMSRRQESGDPGDIR